jgi:hypothetical protein
MLPSLIYYAVRRLLRLLIAGNDRDDAAREIEILVSGHQLRVLSRGHRPPRRARGACLFLSGADSQVLVS